MENKSIHSKAAGILRKVLSKPEPVPTPGEEPKPADPAAPATPADPATPAATTN